MLGPVQGFGRFGYGALYSVPATYLYLITTNGKITVPMLGNIDSGVVSAVLLVFSLYGALWLHRAGLLIFGDHAGMQSTKTMDVIWRHTIYFSTGSYLEDLSANDSKLLTAYNAFQNIDLNRQTLLIFIRYLPAALFALYIYIGWIWLSFLLVDGGTVAAGLLWLILSIFIFQDKVAGYLPDHIPPESIDTIDEAEYMRVRRELSEDKTPSRPRIKSRQARKPKPRVR